MVMVTSWMVRDMLFLVLVNLVVFLPAVSVCEREVTTNQWMVELNGEGGLNKAIEVAKRTGFTVIGPVRIYLFILKVVISTQ